LVGNNNVDTIIADRSLEQITHPLPPITQANVNVIALSGNDNSTSPIITSVFHSDNNGAEVQCHNTLLDTGNLDYNVMNTVMCNQLLNAGHIVDNDATPYVIMGYDNKPTSVNTSIEIPRITLKLPAGDKSELNVFFLVFDSVDTTEPEVILSNRFLRERFHFDVVTQLCEHISSTTGFDSIGSQNLGSNEQLSQLPVPTQDDIKAVIADTDSSDDDQSISLAESLKVCNWMSENKGISRVAPAEMAPKPTTINTSEWSMLKYQLVTILLNHVSNNESMSVSMKENVISVDTSEGHYTLSRQTVVDGNSVLGSSVTTETLLSAVPSLDGAKLPEYASVPEADVQPAASDVDTSARSAKRRRILDLLSQYYDRPAPWPQNPLDSTASTSYKLAVEVEPANRQRDLSHLKPYKFRFGPVLNKDGSVAHPKDLKGANPYIPMDMLHSRQSSSYLSSPPQLGSSHLVDVTDGFSQRQIDAYVRRMKVRKVRLFALAAREQLPRSTYMQEDLNTVLIDGEDLTKLVHANMKRYKVDNIDEVEMDATVKSNPKAFWFGSPETPDELKAFVDERISNAKDNLKDDPDITDVQISQLQDLVNEFSTNLRTRLGNDMVAKIDPFEVKLKPGSEPKKTKLYSMPPNARSQMDQSVNELDKAKLVTSNPKSRWAASAQMVKKPGGAPGELRLVIDYRWLNACTVPIQGGMPILEDDLKYTAGKKQVLH
jgi:hypothetical protein